VPPFSIYKRDYPCQSEGVCIVGNQVRTNIFITQQERSLLAKIALKRKVSTSAVIREYLDIGLGLPIARTVYSHPAKTWEPKRQK
jgi:hypothetical protein